MSPRTKEQVDILRNEKENLIMEVALKLFAENGFESTSVSSIAKEAGISKGLMYNYFESKEDLLHRIVIGSIYNYLKVLQVEDANHIKKEEVIVFINQNLDSVKNETVFFKLYFSLSFQPQVFSLLEKEIMEVFNPIIETFVNYYTQQGYANPMAKARFLFATLDGVGIHYIIDNEHFPLEETKKLIYDLI